MAENKTKATDASVDQYLAAIENEDRLLNKQDDQYRVR